MKALFLLALLASGSAQADIFSPVSGDLSLKLLLQPIFGSLFGGSGDGPLGEAFFVFNGCCLLIGGLLAAYTLVFGTMQTAHDGEMLGKRWSSMWVPIRLAVGTACLVPVGSYCVAQILVAWLGIQGIGLADTVWSAFTHSAIAKDALTRATVPTSNISKLAFGMLRSQVCMEGFKRLASEGGAAIIFDGAPVATGDMNSVRRYGMPGLSATQCGGVVGSKASGGAMASMAGFFGINTGAAEKAAAIREAHANAASSMETELGEVARLIVYNDAAGANAGYLRAINNYQKSVAEAAKAQMGDEAYFEKMADNASTDGWILAGSWFMRLVALEDAIMKALADSPTSMPIEKAPESMGDDMNRYYSSLNGSIHDPTTTGIDNQLVADKEREDSESGIIMSAINSVFDKINEGSKAGFNLFTDADMDRHPILVAASAGHSMIWWGLGLAVASVVAAKVGGTTIAMVLATFIMALIAGGVSLAYLLPMTPFIIWVGVSCGWLLLVIEGVLGAPLWALAHLNPRGEEFHGGASAGYMLVLELTLKPVLMIFGFCFAVLVSAPMGIFINRVFYSTFQFNQSGFVGFIGMLAAMGIYTALMLSMMKYSFSFTHKIPEQILRWMGGGRGSGLAEAAGAASAAEQGGGAIVGAITGAVSGAMTSKLNQMARKEGKEDDVEGKRLNERKVADQLVQRKDEIDGDTQAETDTAFETDKDKDSNA